MVGLPSCPLFGGRRYLERDIPLMMLAALVGSAIPLVRDRVVQLGGTLLLSVAAAARRAGPSVLSLFNVYLFIHKLLCVMVLRCISSLRDARAPNGEYHTYPIHRAVHLRHLMHVRAALEQHAIPDAHIAVNRVARSVPQCLSFIHGSPGHPYFSGFARYAEFSTQFCPLH